QGGADPYFRLMFGVARCDLVDDLLPEARRLIRHAGTGQDHRDPALAGDIHEHPSVPFGLGEAQGAVHALRPDPRVARAALLDVHAHFPTVATLRVGDGPDDALLLQLAKHYERYPRAFRPRKRHAPGPDLHRK